jgi:hypothetical protein
MSINNGSIRSKKIERETVFFVRGIPLNLKAAFKAWCARRAIPMQVKLIEMIKELVRKDEFPGERDDHRKIKNLKKLAKPKSNAQNASKSIDTDETTLDTSED